MWPNGIKHISYHVANPDYDLGHAWQGGTSGWITSVADAVNYVGLHSSIALSNGSPVIAYYDNNDDVLKFANGSSIWDGPPFSWFDEVVDPDANTGQYTSIAEAADGSIHVSYHTPGAGILKHAWGTWDSASLEWQWSTEVIESSIGGSGGYTSLVNGAGNSMHVSYYHAGDDALKYSSGTYDSTSETWSWQTEIVDDPDGENVGKYTAIVVHDSGSIYIAYYDVTNENLKMAHN